MHDLAMRLEQIGREGHTPGEANLVTELNQPSRAAAILHRLRNVV